MTSKCGVISKLWDNAQTYGIIPHITVYAQNKVIIADVRVIPNITVSYYKLRDKTQNYGTTPPITDPVISPEF
jgi:hypothetical protein